LAKTIRDHPDLVSPHLMTEEQAKQILRGDWSSLHSEPREKPETKIYAVQKPLAIEIHEDKSEGTK
jgi:hypothetical protein